MNRKGFIVILHDADNGEGPSSLPVVEIDGVVDPDEIDEPIA